MPLSALAFPQTDPTTIFDLSRGNYASDLLVAAAELKLFDRLAESPCTHDELAAHVKLADRPATVLFTVIRAMGLMLTNNDRKLELTPLAREHLVKGAYFDVSDYFRLMSKSAGVQETMTLLRENRPANSGKDEGGAAFIFREGIESAMESDATARYLTLMLAGRAKNVAPFLAEKVPLSDAKLLLDIGGGTGIYSIACLQKNPNLRAIVWDRPAVLKVASEMAIEYGVADRLECVPGDMFTDKVPSGADVMLLSNILHDWDVPQCHELIHRCAKELSSGGRMLIHDVFLNDAHDGPLWVSLYSAALFCVCEGRAYSAGEYRTWLADAGMTSSDVIETYIHCGVLTGVKR